jgi:hypothetical protein
MKAPGFEVCFQIQLVPRYSEVFEETGVRTEFVSILGIRHGHNIAFGKSDMFFLVVWGGTAPLNEHVRTGEGCAFPK